MLKSAWNRHSKSVCSIVFTNSRGVEFFKCSGFRYKNYLVSELCPEELSRAKIVTICFSDGSGILNGKKLVLKGSEFRARIIGIDSEGPGGIMVIHIESGELDHLSPIINIQKEYAAIGTDTSIIAYSCCTGQLTLKRGIVSSLIELQGRILFRIEADIEPGNFGAPLISNESSGVIGMIVGCYFCEADSYHKLKDIINKNAGLIKTGYGNVIAGNIDVLQVLAANQYMIKHLARDLYLTSHKSFGIAIPVKDISRFIRRHHHEKQFNIYYQELNNEQ